MAAGGLVGPQSDLWEALSKAIIGVALNTATTSTHRGHPSPPSPLPTRQGVAIQLVSSPFGQNDSCLSCHCFGHTDIVPCKIGFHLDPKAGGSGCHSGASLLRLHVARCWMTATQDGVQYSRT